MQVRANNYVPGQTTAPTAIPPPVINPGVLNEPTVALNWWWNEYMRVQFNYIHSMVQSNNSGFYATDIFALRFQTEF
jgi:phosphate-selective porin